MIDTAALREKVLDLAIRGKLVPQDPNDEPASVLLERIRAQKLQMVKEGKLKAKDIKDDTIIFKGDDNCHYEKFADGTIKNIQDEIPFELPDTWCWEKLKNIVIKEIKRGKAPVYTTKSSVLVFAQKCNLKQGGINIGLAQYLDESILKKYPNEEFLLPSDIIINSTGTGTLGRIGILPANCFTPIDRIVPDTHITVIRTCKDMVAQYVFSILKQMQPIIETNGEGSTNQKELRPDYIKNIFIPIPPYKEQQKIVSLIEHTYHITTTINTAKEELYSIINLLKSKILELAIQGKLVEQDENDEPASVLLERIRAEKKVQLGKKYVESYIYKGDDNCYYENIPENWVKCSLADIALFERGITFSASAKEMIKTENNIACIRTANVQERLELEDLIYVDKTYMKNNSNKLLKIGDIIMSSANSKELVGKSCIVTSLDGEMTFGGFVLVIRGVKVNPYFLHLYLKNLFLKGAFYRKSTQTTNIANISTRDLEMLEVCLPPLNEQAKIVQKVNDIINILEKSLI